jgi:putative hydrolase of the HAD superfamily
VSTAVLLDLYSTLVHEKPDNPFYSSVASDLAVEPVSWREQYRRLGAASMSGRLPDMAARVALACQESGQARDPALVRAVVDRRMPLFYASMSLDPEAHMMLAHLRSARIDAAIVSNASSYSETVLDALGLRSVVSHVTMSYRVGSLKPEPAIYLAALEALGVQADQAVFIGDGGDGELRGARAVGMRTVLVDRGLPHTSAARSDADDVCTSLLDAMHRILEGERMRAHG